MGLLISGDPGGTSGFCVAEYSSGKNFQLLQSLEYRWENRFKIFNLIYANRARITGIVLEEYRLFANKLTLHSQIGSEIPSARIIGIVELSATLAQLNCITFQKPGNIHEKDPQTGKTKYSLSVIPEHKALIYPSKHCLDAYMHMRYYVLTTARKQTNGK